MHGLLAAKIVKPIKMAPLFFQKKNFLNHFTARPTFYNKNVIILQLKKNDKAMKWNELRRIAEEKGWYSWRKGGNHDIYRHPDKDEFLYIERHESQEIRHGLYCKLKKIIGF